MHGSSRPSNWKSLNLGGSDQIRSDQIEEPHQHLIKDMAAGQPVLNWVKPLEREK
jgi:hypothetical protein